MLKAMWMQNPKAPRVWKKCESAPNMTPNQRLTYNLGAALGAEQRTPGMGWFQEMARGRVQSWPAESAAHPVTRIVQHPDGTCDTIGLHAHGKVYIDLGGRGARDTAIRRP